MTASRGERGGYTALSGKRRVETPDGAVEVSLPEGVQPGEVLRPRGKGRPRVGDEGRGDPNLRVALELPRAPSERERALHRELARLGDEASK